MNTYSCPSGMYKNYLRQHGFAFGTAFAVGSSKGFGTELISPKRLRSTTFPLSLSQTMLCLKPQDCKQNC